jgi:hypothetical protein
VAAAATTAAGTLPASDVTSADAADDDDEGLCVCCLDAPSSVLFLHGALGHLSMCGACLAGYDWRIGGCPVCREPVKDVLHITA